MLVQQQLSAPVELVAGLVHDRPFGTVVLLGLAACAPIGSTTARAARAADRSRRRADVAQLHCAPLLAGYRREPPVDTAGLEDLLLRLGRLAEDLPEIAELDVNPVLAGPAGIVAVDAEHRLAPLGTEPDPALRRLRPVENV